MCSSIARITAFGALLTIVGLLAGEQLPIIAAPALPMATNIVSARRLAASSQSVACSLRLEGVALWAAADGDKIILQDDTGGLLIEMDLRNQSVPQVGQRVRVEGTAVAGAGTIREALVNNDGLHSATERSETIYLQTGRHPIRMDWFNGPTEFKLQVDYEGPGLPRQKLPDSALSELSFRCYEGRWERLPNFAQLAPIKTGTASNFDLAVRSRDQRVALQFTGAIEIPREGSYTFWVNSDDGSQLFLDKPSLRLTLSDSVALPTPHRVNADQNFAEEDDCRWTQIEGTLTAVHVNPDGELEGEITCASHRMFLQNAQSPASLPPLLSRIRATGIYRRTVLTGSHAATERLLIPGSRFIETLSPPTEIPSPHRISSVAQLRRLGSSGERAICPLHLEGVVAASSPSYSLLALQLESGAVLVEMDLGNQSPLPGTRVTLEGNGVLQGDRLVLGPAPLVNNDGLHSSIEKSGSVLLNAGKHPVQILWFSRDDPGELSVYYQGPGLPRQLIPRAALFRVGRDPIKNSYGWVPGVDYRCYQGSWSRLPDFNLLAPVKEGSATNFYVSVAGQSASVGLEFSGALEIPRDGLYTFTTGSDAGSLLFIGDQATRLEVTGTNAPPQPIAISAGQLLSEEQQDRWTQIEGRVTFASHTTRWLELELSSGTGRMRVEVADDNIATPRVLLESRIRATGICPATFTTDGQQAAGLLLVPDIKNLKVLEIAPERWADCPVMRIGDLLKTNFTDIARRLVHIRGISHSRGPGQPLLVEDATGRIPIETIGPPVSANDVPVEVLGQCKQLGTSMVLGGCFLREVPEQTQTAAAQRLPLLTTIEQVKGLSRQEAQRGYPVKIHGIITAPMLGGFFLQDATWAIYARLETPVPQDSLRAGDYWEVEGVTFAEFAPNVLAVHATRLGAGILPEPFRPAWDQLINGSLDTRYIEVQGVVTALTPDNMALLTRAGKLILELWGTESEALKQFVNARIRVRGCVMPARDVNNQVELGRLRLVNFSFNVDEPAPADPFAGPLKSATDLRFFDARAGAIERVKIAGQIVHARRGEYSLMEGTNGVRFIPATATEFKPGDLVEVVGFPDLAGPSPVLREAVVRRAGNAALPPPQPLSDTSLLSRSHDATLVSLEARLAGLSINRGEQILEMQSGALGFVARLETARGPLAKLAPGSRLRLTGTYLGHGGDRASGRDIDSFELLLNSPADILVLQRPPWWNLQHTITVVAAMAFVILAAIIWITLLRRQVEERSHQLTAAMQRHEQAERQRALEQERSRIAQDLHDDLGATLTQIRLLSALESRDALVPSSTRSRMGQVTEKSRQLVASLDEIVWAVNPANDSLPSLATYFCQFAEEFVRPADIRCRLDVAEALPRVPLNSEIRHNLYLAVRETLNNVLKHSQAKEIWLRIQWDSGVLRIIIEDNGCGFVSSSTPATRNGLVNLCSRLEKIGGNFDFQSQPGTGTTCRISLPLSARATENSTTKN